MPKKKGPKIGRRFKGRRHSAKQLFETIPLQMNQIISENHCVTIQNKHLCRTCLSETNIGEFHMVFEESISEMLATLAKVEVSKDDGLPSYICKLCKSKLDLAYAFQIQCRKSDDLLRKTKENNCNLKDTKTTSYHNHVAFDEVLIKPELGNNLTITENNEQKLFGEMRTHWITNEISSNSDCNLKDTKITRCCNNTQFNEAFKNPELGNNFKITENNEQKSTGEMQTHLATNVISSNGDCDIKGTEIIFGNTKVSNKDIILIKTELEDIDFKMTENNEQMLIGDMKTHLALNKISSNDNCDISDTVIMFGNKNVCDKDMISIKTELEDSDFEMTENDDQKLFGEMPTYLATNEISTNSDCDIKETEIVGNDEATNKDVIAVNTELETHIERNQATEEHFRTDSRIGKRIRCRKCRIDFKSLNRFNAHNERVHMNFVCNQCGKRFSKRSLLRQHERVHKVGKPFICTICGDAFTTAYYLTTHRKSHSEAYPYKCEYCPKVFAVGIYLLKHNMVHAITKEVKG